MTSQNPRILWDSIDTDDPQQRDRELLYQIATGDYDLVKRHRALDLMERLPEQDRSLVLAEVAGEFGETEEDEEIVNRAFELLEYS